MKLAVPPQLVVFDLDGTLVDSGIQVATLLNELRQDLGKPPLGLECYVPWLSLGGLQLISHGLEISQDAAPSFLGKFREMYRLQPTPPDSIFPGVRSTLNELEALGIEMSICTNKPRGLAEKILRELGLTKYFKSMCAGGDLPTQKPDPANLRHCLEAHGVPGGRAILIGDSRVDQKVALACGVQFGWYVGGNDDGVLEAEVDFRFADFARLPAHLGLETPVPACD